MMTLSEPFKSLAAPFEPKDIEWRMQTATEKKVLVLAYVTNRAIMERLDAACGPDNWKNEYTKGPEGGILCGISIRINNEWVTKWDGAENTDIEGVKGGLSNSMKRAAVQWGIGRYLYNLEAAWVDLLPKYKGEYGVYDKKKNIEGSFNAPHLPAFALPDGFKYTGTKAPANVDTATGEIKEEPKQATTSIHEEMDKPKQEEFKPLNPKDVKSLDQVTDLEDAIIKNLGQSGSEVAHPWRKTSLKTTDLATCNLEQLRPYYTALAKHYYKVMQSRATNQRAN